MIPEARCRLLRLIGVEMAFPSTQRRIDPSISLFIDKCRFTNSQSVFTSLNSGATEESSMKGRTVLAGPRKRL
jgi:hypothetical protein